MNRSLRTLLSSLVLLAGLALMIATPPAHAGEPGSLRDAIGHARQLLLDLKAGLPVETSNAAEPASGFEPAAFPGKATPRPRIIGTWVVHVPGADPSQDFDALHTFGADGTFVETSSLLGTLVEGPAHGVWSQTGNGFLLTFQLFAFDDEGNPAGMIRVRCRIVLLSSNSLRASTVVDILPPGEAPILAVASGDYTGSRLALVAP
jgi:hypothetical protein